MCDVKGNYMGAMSCRKQGGRLQSERVTFEKISEGRVGVHLAN